MIVSVLTFNLEEAAWAILKQRIAGLPDDHPLHQVRHVWIGFDHGEDDVSMSSLKSPLRDICRDSGADIQTNLVIECADSDPDSPWRGFTGRSFGKLEPSIKHAESIAQFVMDWHDEDERVVLCVHCRRGHFRSGAVAQWVTEDLGIEEHEASRRIVDCGNVDPPYNHTILRLLREAAKQGEQLKTYTRWSITDATTGRSGQIRFHRKNGKLSIHTGIDAGNQTHYFETPDFEMARRKLLEVFGAFEEHGEEARESDGALASAQVEVSVEAPSQSGPAFMIATETEPSSFVPDGASGGARKRNGTQKPAEQRSSERVRRAFKIREDKSIQPLVSPSQSTESQPKSETIEWSERTEGNGSSQTTTWTADLPCTQVRVERTRYQDGEEWHACNWAAVEMCTPIPTEHCSPEAAKAWAIQWAQEWARDLAKDYSDPQELEAQPESEAVEWEADYLRSNQYLARVWIARLGVSHLRVKDTQYPHGREWRAYYWADSAKVDYTTALIPEGHHSPEAAQAWALQWVREGAQTLEQSSESNETGLVQEPAPAPRGRVVTRWRTNLVGDDVLSTPTVVARVQESTPGFRVSIDVRGSNICVGATTTRERGRSYAERAIRELIAPFGGELVVEGEP